MNLHKPNLLKTILWYIGLWEMEPSDIGNQQAIVAEYPSMGGDRDQGIGNYGDCPDYRGDRTWWVRFLKDRGVK